MFHRTRTGYGISTCVCSRLAVRRASRSAAQSLSRLEEASAQHNVYASVRQQHRPARVISRRHLRRVLGTRPPSCPHAVTCWSTPPSSPARTHAHTPTLTQRRSAFRHATSCPEAHGVHPRVHPLRCDLVAHRPLDVQRGAHICTGVRCWRVVEGRGWAGGRSLAGRGCWGMREGWKPVCTRGRAERGAM